MALSVTNIRTSIIELMEGTIGVDSPDDGVFEHGAFDGQPDDAKLAKLRQASTAAHWFDVTVGELRPHEASAISTRGSTRLLDVAIDIDIWTGLATEAQESSRSTVLADISNDCEVARNALAYLNNLDDTAAGGSTGIVGGVMRSRDHSGYPAWEIVSEDWKRRFIHSRISGAVIVGAS